MNKGKKGELEFAKLLINIATIEDNVEFKKPTYTNAPDNGLDFQLRCPHNLPEKIEKIINNEEENQILSETTIEVRVDVKNYANKIGQSVAKKFVDDISKNKNCDEHWLCGGDSLTSGAKEVLENANKEIDIVRYFSNDNLNQLDNYYINKINNEVNNEIDEETSE